MISMIVAKSRNNVIGAGNTIPWHLPADLRHFKETTQGHTIIMGRLTWESLPFRPLPRRRNMVVTSQPECVNQAESFSTLEAAIAAIGPDEQAFIIGGQQLYQSSMNLVDQIIVSELAIDVEGDRLFPQIDESVWTETNRVAIPNPDIPFEVVTFEKTKFNNTGTETN